MRPFFCSNNLKRWRSLFYEYHVNTRDIFYCLSEHDWSFLSVFWFYSGIQKMTEICQCSKVDFSFSALRKHFMALHLIHLPRRNILEYSSPFVYCSLEHSNKFMHQILVNHWIELFSSMWLSWFFGRIDFKRIFVDSCASTIHACLVSLCKVLHSLQFHQ